MNFFPHTFRLSGFYAASLLALSTLTHAGSGTVEVDLVFTQNDTYAPSPIIPVAFALQRSQLASHLQPNIRFSIFPYGNLSDSVAEGFYYMTWANSAALTPS